MEQVLYEVGVDTCLPCYQKDLPALFSMGAGGNYTRDKKERGRGKGEESCGDDMWREASRQASV